MRKHRRFAGSAAGGLTARVESLETRALLSAATTGVVEFWDVQGTPKRDEILVDARPGRVIVTVNGVRSVKRIKLRDLRLQVDGLPGNDDIRVRGKLGVTL